MTGFTDRFGGSTVNPSDVAYKAYVLSASLITYWPPYADATNMCARTMDVRTSIAGLAVILPDAQEASPGETILFYNNGSFPYDVIGNAGLAIATVQPGDRRFIELIDNTTQDGVWLVTLLGVGVANLDIAGSAGAGLKAIGTTLNVAFVVDTVSSSRTIGPGDRDKVLVWTGGAGTLMLPSTSGYVDFNFEIRNQGTGTLVLLPSGGELIDNVASLTFNNAESAWVHADLGAWFTVGRGRNAQFNFTQLVKTVSGGTIIETLTEAANVVQTFTGVLTSDLTVILPSVVQVYYIANQTTGTFSFTIKNVGPGLTLALPSGQTAVVFSDGINVTNASTSTSGLAQFTFGPGTVTAPSVAIGTANTGFFSPGAGQVAFSSGGSSVFTLGATGVGVSIAGNAALGVTSTGGTATVTVSRPANIEASIQFRTIGSPRFSWGVDGATEAGANSGSNAVLRRFDDAGALLGTPIQVDRKTGAVTIPGGVRDLTGLGEVRVFLGDAVARTGFLYLDGSLVSRTTYADLWAYAQTTGPVAEATWNAGYYGRFSVGDGSTNFRLPDLRGSFVRSLDTGRGYDPGRPWGLFQDHANVVHNHGVSDPGHNHTVNDPTHAHSVADSGHSHGGGTDTQGTHQHGYTYTNPAGIGTGVGGAIGLLVNNVQGAATDANGAHNHNIGTDVRAANIGIYGNYTGVYLSAALASVSIQNSGAGDGHPRNMAYPSYVRY